MITWSKLCHWQMVYCFIGPTKFCWYKESFFETLTRKLISQCQTVIKKRGSKQLLKSYYKEELRISFWISASAADTTAANYNDMGIILQSALGITKCDSYSKVIRNNCHDTWLLCKFSNTYVFYFGQKGLIRVPIVIRSSALMKIYQIL